MEVDKERKSGAGESSNHITRSKEEFARKLKNHFEALLSRGVSPNDAAVSALKLASDTAEKSLDLPAFFASVKAAKRSGNCTAVICTIGNIFSSAEALDSSFILNAVIDDSVSHKTQDVLSIDFKSVQDVYRELTTFGSDVGDALMLASERLLDSLLQAAEEAGGWPETGTGLLRQVLILLENPLLIDPNHHDILCKLMRVITSQPSSMQAALVFTIISYTYDQLIHIVSVVQHFITIHLYESQQIDESIESATRLLSLLHDANNKCQKLSYVEFYNDAVNNEEFDIKEDYRRWKQPERYRFAFCQYPFIYDPSSKSRILQLESTMKMSHEFEDAVLRSIFIGATCPYLVLKVRRDYLIPDTLMQISRRPDDLKKPLKVHFVGEEGVDEGGVQKEFFQLLIRQIFDPSFCMFSYDEDARQFWFKASPLDLDTEFELVGIVLGLAIYNGHILEFRFPMVIYRKLMGLPTGLSDLAEANPTVARSFKQLLDYTGNVEENFGLNFQVSYEVLGEVCTVDLVDDGANVPVTNANREEYVKLHTHFILESSIERQFTAFKQGFNRLCGGPVLRLFRPEELEQLVCGSPVLDFEALERNTQYDDGYSKDSEAIRLFWRVVHSLREEEKKKLLFFATGSDRVPIKGLSNLPFVISRNGPHSDRLPTAHTCFNHLLLPEYTSEDFMRERIMTAINNAEGFGLM
eukprot:1189995-Prorocentrum_minimum.AAC.2